jgi:hypothetical protein
MTRGLDVGIHLRPDLPNEEFVAGALGNLAAFELQLRRKETLQWQVLRIDGSPGQHHFRLIIRHPDRLLDLGIQRDLVRILNDLSNETEEQLAQRFTSAQSQGLHPQRVRPLHEEVDYWRDDFWNWFG